MFAQIDDTVGEPQRNLIEQKIGERDFFREDGIAVAVFALSVAVRSARTASFLVGEIFRAVCEKDVPVDVVPVPCI